MLRGNNPGTFDYVLTFYAPTKSKDSICATINTLSSQGSCRAERVFKRAGEKIEGQQQVGTTVQDFRIYDRQFTITQEWEFDAQSIAETSTQRYRVTGIAKEGRGNTVLITAETRDDQ